MQLMAMESGGTGPGRRIAVLGDMLELGSESGEMHEALAELSWMAKVDQIHCVGPLMQGLWQVSDGHRQGLWFESAEEMAAQIGALIGAGDVVLVKGSKGSKVSLVVDAIRKLGHPLSTRTRGII